MSEVGSVRARKGPLPLCVLVAAAAIRALGRASRVLSSPTARHNMKRPFWSESWRRKVLDGFSLLIARSYGMEVTDDEVNWAFDVLRRWMDDIARAIQPEADDENNLERE